MSGDREPHDVSSDEPDITGQHRLGQHVVGQRIVVRRLLRGQRGPSGGPAFTDLLGTCLSWTDAWCVVQSESGDTVEIAVADIVSGKPVPPRASVRHRVAPLDAQVRALDLWPDLETAPLGSWLLRHSPTATARRANSVLAFGPSGVPDDVDRVIDHYAGPRGRTGRPIAAVLSDSAEEELFRSRGWVPESTDSPTVFQIAPVSRVARALRISSSAVVDGTQSFATARLDDRASGVAAYADDWMGMRSIEVAPAHRRQGLALQVIAALVDWAAEQGATTAYLQVLGDNAPALALYERLGFTTHHTYCYLSPA